MISSRTRARSWYAKCGVAGPTSSSIASFVGSATARSLPRMDHTTMGSVEAMRRVTRADLMLLVTVVLWGFNVTVTKYVLTHGFRPLAYSAVRYGGAALLFCVLTYGIER